LVPDGVFTVGERGAAEYVELSRPTREELQAMVERIAAKTLAMAKRRGLLEEEPCDALSRVQAESVQACLPLPTGVEAQEKLSGFAEGFSLEAGRHVEASNREALEHLLRYMLRPPVSNKRLEKLADGRVQLTMKRALYDGTRAIALTPRELMRRLAAIVPPPLQSTGAPAQPGEQSANTRRGTGECSRRRRRSGRRL
jgi:hypothetical protein